MENFEEIGDQLEEPEKAQGIKAENMELDETEITTRLDRAEADINKGEQENFENAWDILETIEEIADDLNDELRERFELQKARLIEESLEKGFAAKRDL